MNADSKDQGDFDARIISLRAILTLFVAYLLISSLLFLGNSNWSFLSDDFVILNAVRLHGAFGIWSSRDSDFFRPAASFFFHTAYLLWKTNPIGYLFSNIILHSINSILTGIVFLLLIRCFSTERNLPPRLLATALSSSFLFLLHPSHSETVSWIATFTELNACLFALSSIACYLWFIQGAKRRWLLYSLISFAISIFTKESTVTVPLIVLAITLLSPTKNKETWHLRKYGFASHFALLAVYLVARFLTLGTLIGGYGKSVHLQTEPKRIMASLAGLSTRSLLPPLPSNLFAVALFGLLVTFFIAFAIIRKCIRKPAVFTLLCLLSGLPAINLSIHLTNTQGERFVYFPSVFAVYTLALLLDCIIRSQRRFAITVILIGTVFGGFLYNSNQRWRQASSITLSILDSLKYIPETKTLYLLNLPDNIGGAYIFRNGFEDAIELLGIEKRFESVRILTRVHIKAPDEKIVANTNYNRIDVRIETPQPMRITRSALSSPSYKLVWHDDRHYSVTFLSLDEKDRIATFANRKIELLPLHLR